MGRLTLKGQTMSDSSDLKKEALYHKETEITTTEEKQEDKDEYEGKRTKIPVSDDRAVNEFSEGSLRAVTNQFGTQGKKFHVEPRLASVSSAFPYSDTLHEGHAIQDFFVYDGAQATIGAQGKMATSRDQVMPNKRIREQDAIYWNRVGSKKGYMFETNFEDNYVPGETIPSSTYLRGDSKKGVKRHKWTPIPRTTDSQGMALRDEPDVQRTNLGRGIGVSRGGYGSMAGGYQQVTKERIRSLAKPMAKWNHTGNRQLGSARTDRSGTANRGAGGYRSGYKSIYPDFPYFINRKSLPA